MTDKNKSLITHVTEQNKSWLKSWLVQVTDKNKSLITHLTDKNKSWIVHVTDKNKSCLTHKADKTKSSDLFMWLTDWQEEELTHLTDSLPSGACWTTWGPWMWQPSHTHKKFLLCNSTTKIHKNSSPFVLSLCDFIQRLYRKDRPSKVKSTNQKRCRQLSLNF